MDIVKSIYRKIWTIGPIYLAQIILICLIVYRLTKDKLSIEEKKQISYAELPISFIASFMLIFIYGQPIFFIISNLLRKATMSGFRFLICCLLFLLITPFTFSVLRVVLENKVSEQQKLILSVLTIPITIYAGYVTTVIATFSSHRR